MVTMGDIPVHAGLPTTLAVEWWDRMWFGSQGVDGSTFSRGVDHVFFYIFWVSTIFFVPMMLAMGWWAWKYRRRPGVPPEPSPAHNTVLEISWSVIPTILLAVMFFWGLIEYLPMKIAPADAEIVNVTAKKWAWSLVYDNGASPLGTERIADMEGPVFAVPVNRPTKFIMSSQDVIHSMYLPALRIKRDVFPNFYTSQWATPKKVSHEWDDAEKTWKCILPNSAGFFLACTEYCGDQHSQMWGRMMVLSEADYQRWKKDQANTDAIDLLTLGGMLHKSKGCNACHTLDGSTGTGPTWKGIWGETTRFKDGGTAVVDENYIRESILEPAKHIKEGFSNQMPTFQGQVTPRELIAISTFIRSLGAKAEDKAGAEEFSTKEMESKKGAVQ
jgi:cytochrome c oxidase subunit 2